MNRIHFLSYLAQLFVRKNVSDKVYREDKKTHFMFNNIFFEIRAIYEKMWKNREEPGRPHLTIWRLHISR